MSWSFQYDPVTRDLISNGRGGFARTETAETTVMHQMLCRFGAYWGMANLGSRLHDLRSLQPKPEVQAPLEARRALDVLVARGVIANVEVTADKPTQGRVVVATRFRDTSTGQLVSTYVQPGGR